MRCLRLLVLLVTVAACGGNVAKDAPGSAGAGETAGTPAAAAAGSASGGATSVGGATPSNSAGTNTVQLIDDADYGGSDNRAVPPGSSAFFWSGHLGNWFVTSSDGATTDAHVDTPDASADPTGKAYHASGKQGEGVDLWAQLNHPAGSALDLGAYSGISFKARLSGATESLRVAFSANGESFVSERVFPNQRFTATPDWQTFTLKFADVGLDAPAISSIDFVVEPQRGPFELWIDDAALLCAATCP